MATDQAEKVRENKLRAAAARQGYRLVKSSRRDKRATDYGRWMITSATTGEVVAGAAQNGRPGMTLDQIEEWLTR